MKTRSLSSHVSTCRLFTCNCLLKALVSAILVVILLLALLLSIQGLLTFSRSLNTIHTPTVLPFVPRQATFTDPADFLTPTILQTSHTLGTRSMRIGSIRTTASASRTTLQPRATTDALDQKLLSNKGISAYRRSTSITVSALDAHPGLMSGTQTISTKSKTQFILSSGQTIPLGSKGTLDAGNSTTTIAPETSGTQDLLVSGSSTSQLSNPTAAPDVSKNSPLLTISRQTITADSMSQYDVDSQTLTPGGFNTVAGAMTSVAPGKSSITLGTSTKALSANNTAGINSGPHGTNVQSFKGSALGAGDGLWTSSIVVVLGVAIPLLWL